LKRDSIYDSNGKILFYSIKDFVKNLIFIIFLIHQIYMKKSMILLSLVYFIMFFWRCSNSMISQAQKGYDKQNYSKVIEKKQGSLHDLL
jgi:uncharacterized membrane protein YukC